jgi:hypothetical protein
VLVRTLLVGLAMVWWSGGLRAEEPGTLAVSNEVRVISQETGAPPLVGQVEADILGKRVRVDSGAPVPVVGLVTGVDADALLIQTSERGDVRRMLWDDILGLEVSRGYKRHTVRGLAGGALAWLAVVGLYAAFDTLDESGVGEPLLIAGMVGAGGVVGSFFKTERWERLPVSAASVRVIPRKRGVQAEIVVRF